MKPQAFLGNLCHTPTVGSVEILKQHLLLVDASGVISFLGPADSLDASTALQQHGLLQQDVCTLSQHQFLLPGFIDTHCHAPQYAFTGVGTDLPLFDWLQTYTFPCEASFQNVQHAQRVYTRAVQRMLRLGTTTSNYFTTLHVEACKVLVDIIETLGQRAVLGKCCMDQHGPEFYLDCSAEESLQGAKEVAAYIKAKGCGRITASVIPRFIPTCSPALLKGLGELAQQEGLVVHSHISESIDQVEFSLKLHPDAAHDAAIYDAAGLLTSRSVFAHGTQLTLGALQLMAARGAAVAHCPLSNLYFGDGLFCVAQALACGVKVGLGTDVAGGYSPSMLQAMRMAVVNGHALKAAALMNRGQQPQQKSQEEEEELMRGGTCNPALQQCAANQPKEGTCTGPSHQQHQLQQGELRTGQSPSVSAPAHGPASKQPHSTTAGLAGSKVAAGISSPAVSAAALQHQLSWEDALFLATAGGAAALGLNGIVGHFAVGMQFDALLVDCSLTEVFDVLQDGDNPLMLLEHFIHNGDDRNIVGVWVQGQRCCNRD